MRQELWLRFSSSDQYQGVPQRARPTISRTTSDPTFTSTTQDLRSDRRMAANHMSDVKIQRRLGVRTGYAPIIVLQGLYVPGG